MTEISFTLPEPTILLNPLLRMHWRARRRYCEGLSWAVRAALSGDLGKDVSTPIPRCKIAVTRFSAGPMPDWDGLYGGLKPLLDCLVVPSKRNPHGLGIIEDDNPGVVIELVARPVRCRRAEQRTEVRIIPIE